MCGVLQKSIGYVESYHVSTADQAHIYQDAIEGTHGRARYSDIYRTLLLRSAHPRESQRAQLRARVRGVDVRRRLRLSEGEQRISRAHAPRVRPGTVPRERRG